MGRMRNHIAFHLHPETLLLFAVGFVEILAASSIRRVKGGGGAQAQPVSLANDFFKSPACGQHASRVCKPRLLSALSRAGAGSGVTTCTATVSSNTRPSG